MSLDLPPALHVETVLGAIDTQARRSASRAGTVGVAAVRRYVPARTGRARAGVARRVRRSLHGYLIEVYPSAKSRYASGVTSKQVLGWLERGTGEYGPRGRPIRPRRGHAFHLPGGWVSGSIRGQRAQHPFARALTSSDATVVRELETGASIAARNAERVLGG